MDLQNDADFKATGVQLVSIAFDSVTEQQNAITEYGIEIPMLVDASHEVSQEYDVLQWAVGTGEPGHTFILVNADGQIVWTKDYGSPKLANPVMYVDTSELVGYIGENLK